MQPYLTPGQLDDRDRRRFRLFNGPQPDPTRQGKRSDVPYFRKGHGRILGPDDFMPVGEHAGKHLRAVPPEFLLWVDQQPWSTTWAPWEAVHSYIERYILSDPETAAGIALPVGPVIFVDSLRQWPTSIPCFKAGSAHLHTLPGFEDFLHAFAVGALHLKTAWFQHEPGKLPHYDLTVSKHASALQHGAQIITDTQLIEHRTQWRTHFQTSRQFVPENASDQEREHKTL